MTDERLSETDVHYVVGYLYVVARRDDVVVLGARIRDQTTETDRDVDIVVSGEWGVLGIEVKDKSRPLDVGIVEGLCQKFHDMPEIKRRAIVSSSDFTEPARRKAAAHDVVCLRFVRDALPSSFAGPDMSTLRTLTTRLGAWAAPPRVEVETRTNEILRDLPPSARVRPGPGEAPGPPTLGAMVATLPARHEVAEGGLVDLTCEINYPLAITTPRGRRNIRRLRVVGTVALTNIETPLRTTCYLADEHDRAEAALVLFDYEGGLLGVAGGTDGRATIIRIPASMRDRRPNRLQISNTR